MGPSVVLSTRMCDLHAMGRTASKFVFLDVNAMMTYLQEVPVWTEILHVIFATRDCRPNAYSDLMSDVTACING